MFTDTFVVTCVTVIKIITIEYFSQQSGSALGPCVFVLIPSLLFIVLFLPFRQCIIPHCSPHDFPTMPLRH